jgi:hypothetical protein
MSNLILSKHDIPRFNLFSPRPRGEPGVAIVLFRDNGALTAIKAGQSFTAADVAWGTYKGYYLVDVGEHSFSFQTRIPCEKDAFYFEASVTCIYQVSDPAIVVDRQIKDAESVLKTYILEKMRGVSRKYTTQQSEAAEKQLNTLFGEGFTINGLTANKIIVDLSLDEVTKAHVRQLQEIENQKVREAAQHDLAMMQENFNQEIQRVRMQFYTPLIEQGQWQMLALYLANNPSDVGVILDLMQRQRKAELELQLQALKAFLDGNVIEDFQIADNTKAVLQKLADNLLLSENKLLLPGDGTTDAPPPEKKKKPKIH